MLPVETDDFDSDATLLDRYRRGDEDAATQLYRRYAGRLCRITDQQLSANLTARVDNEDVLQSVFRSFFRRVSDGQYTLAAGEELWKLLLVIAVNKVRSLGKHHRARKRDVRATSGSHSLPSLSGSDAGAAYQELQFVLSELLESLPEAQQQIVQMRLEGHDINEITAQSRRARRTVERVLQDFRAELRRKLYEDAP
jgi:RNA polymerase sigma-70 factor (ECF subfamily)